MFTVLAAVALLAAGAGSAEAHPAAQATNAGGRLQARADGDKAAPGPAKASALASPSACGMPAEGQKIGCLTATGAHATAPAARLAASQATTSAAPIPQWCIDNAYKGVYGLRTEACQVTGLTYTTYTTTNGVTSTTGQVSMNVINYEYSDTGLINWAHQIEVAGYSGWGDALNGSVGGSAISSGSCTTNNSSFPTQGLSPLQSWRVGEAFFDTTATAPGAIGNCTTTWELTFSTPGYTPGEMTYPTANVRCDNATAGNPNTGCVVPWYPAPVYYSQSANPTLANHVSQAQASGLPGGTFAAPLYRTTSDTITNANRTQACGDAPSIAGLSCDEYPLASTYNGLTAGGTRRTFDGCNFNLPRQTGATGVSVCMIAAGDNSSQGGLMSQFYRSQRVLDSDPYRVLVVA